MSGRLAAEISRKLCDRHDVGLLRKLRLVDSYIDFCLNDYLGLARDANLSAAIHQSLTTILGDSAIGSTGTALHDEN